jgi:hypothetical protein
MMIYGVILVLAMNVRPHGLIDEAVVHRIKQMVKREPADARS